MEGSSPSKPPSGHAWKEHMRGRLKENLPTPEELLYAMGDELAPWGHLMTEKGWEHGWSIEGHPYIAHSNMFIMEEAGKEDDAAARSGPAVAPAWAPRYPYPRALNPKSEAQKEQQRTNALDILLQDTLESPDAKLPLEALAAIEDVALAFQRCDNHEFMMALDRLQSCQERVCGAREAMAANVAQPGPAMAVFERELLKRFSKISFSDPEAHAAFLESLPGPIRSVLEPIRLVEEASKVAEREQKTSGSASAADAVYNWDKRPTPSSILPFDQEERKRPAQIAKTELNCEKPGMSQAVIKLPWSSEEKWERRFEQDLMWHPGCYYASHQANPNQRK